MASPTKRHALPGVDWTTVLLDARLTPEDILTAGIRSTRLEEQAKDAAEVCPAAQFYLLYQIGAASRPELAEAYRALGVRQYFHDEQGRQALVFPGGSLVVFGTLTRGGRPVAIYQSGRRFRKEILRVVQSIETGSLEDRILQHYAVRAVSRTGSRRRGGRRPRAGRPSIDGEPRKWITVSLPAALVQEIENRARQRQITRSQAVLDMLRA